LTTCELQELSQPPADAGTECPQAVGTFDSAGSCASSMQPGWCYYVGSGPDSCPQAILFSSGQPPSGATVSLQCIESSSTYNPGG
jgi:hypothetical protein